MLAVCLQNWGRFWETFIPKFQKIRLCPALIITELRPANEEGTRGDHLGDVAPKKGLRQLIDEGFLFDRFKHSACQAVLNFLFLLNFQRLLSSLLFYSRTCINT